MGLYTATTQKLDQKSKTLDKRLDKKILRTDKIAEFFFFLKHMMLLLFVLRNSRGD